MYNYRHKVFINRNWLGSTDNPHSLISLFKLYRRNGIIPTYYSIRFHYRENEISVFTRTPEGTKIKEFKAICTIDASASKILSEIKDVENHQNWIKDIINPKLLKLIQKINRIR